MTYRPFLNVGVDLDGVGYDFGASCIAYAGHIKRKLPKFEFDNWNFFEYWGMTVDEFKQFCHDGADAGFIFTGEERKGFSKAIRQIKAQGHTVHIITDRSFGTTPAVSEKHTREWLKQHNVPYDTLTFSPDKTVVQTDVFIEDKWENYDALEAAGSRPYLITRPWNNQRQDDRRRIKDIREFPDIVQLNSPSLISS